MFSALAWGKARALRSSSGSRRKSAGQSLVEFTLVLPLLLLIVLVGTDFGRSYQAWVGLNNAARIAANYASLHADAWGSPGNATYRTEYAQLVTNDFRNAGCAAPNPIPDPIFIDGGSKVVGSRVQVLLTCHMPLITPLIGSVFPAAGVTITGGSIFVIRNGTIAGTGSGGGSGAPVPTFTANPMMGDSPLTVTFVNTTANPGTVSNWYWDFGDSLVSTLRDPGTHTYTVPGTYLVTLLATNTSGSGQSPATQIIVNAPPTLTADFSWLPLHPVRGQVVTFTATASGGLPAYTWAWTFGDGNTSAVQNPTHTYNSTNTFHVTLTVRDAALATVVKSYDIVVASPMCTVPSLLGVRTNKAQGDWTGAGFTTSVTFSPGAPPTYTIHTQSQPIGASLPCDTTSVTVTP
jgi:PKD repeat protein